MRFGTLEDESWAVEILTRCARSLTVRARETPQCQGAVATALPWTSISSSARREGVAEHGQPAKGLGLGGLVLQHIPVFDQQAPVQAHDVGRYPVGQVSATRESAVQDD